MVSVLASSAVDRGFEPWSGQTKDYKIGIWCFSAKHDALRSKSKPVINFNFVDVNQQEKETEKKKDQSNEYMTGKLDNF
jgi:hypothetical protein